MLIDDIRRGSGGIRTVGFSKRGVESWGIESELDQTPISRTMYAKTEEVSSLRADGDIGDSNTFGDFGGHLPYVPFSDPLRLPPS